MTTQLKLQSRLRAAKNIKQIATSMEMVATARFRKAQDKAKHAQFYSAKIEEILKKIEDSHPGRTHSLFKQKFEGKTCVVIVSSDRGLCGSYNTRVFSTADRFLKDKQHEKVELILLGTKAIRYYQNKQWAISCQLSPWAGKIKLLQIKELSNQLIKEFVVRRFNEVQLIYTQFISLTQREVVVETFLPLKKPTGKTKEGLKYIFEPNAEELYDELLHRYCMTKIETMLDVAYASELAARIFAMKSAAQNAEEMIEHLTLEHNKVRQAAITRELLETTGGHTDGW